MRIGEEFEEYQQMCVEDYDGPPYLLNICKEYYRIPYVNMLVHAFVDIPKNPEDFPSVPETPEMTDDVWKFVVHILKMEDSRNSSVYADSIARWTGISEEIAQAIFTFVDDFDAEKCISSAIFDCICKGEEADKLTKERSVELMFFYNAMVKLYWRQYVHCLYTGEPFPYKEILEGCPGKFGKCDFVHKASQFAEDEEKFKDILGYSMGEILKKVGDVLEKGVPENVMRCMLPFGPDLTKEIIEISRRKKEG